jgi:hypothetical protein
LSRDPSHRMCSGIEVMNPTPVDWRIPPSSSGAVTDLSDRIADRSPPAARQESPRLDRFWWGRLRVAAVKKAVAASSSGEGCVATSMTGRDPRQRVRQPLAGNDVDAAGARDRYDLVPPFSPSTLTAADSPGRTCDCDLSACVHHCAPSLWVAFHGDYEREALEGTPRPRRASSVERRSAPLGCRLRAGRPGRQRLSRPGAVVRRRGDEFKPPTESKEVSTMTTTTITRRTELAHRTSDGIDV